MLKRHTYVVYKECVALKLANRNINKMLVRLLYRELNVRKSVNF